MPSWTGSSTSLRRAERWPDMLAPVTAAMIAVSGASRAPLHLWHHS